MQTREQLLKNLAKARQVRKQNLAMRKRSPQPQRRVVQKRIYVPRGQTLFRNPQQMINPDLDVTRTDLRGANERISSGADLDVSKTDVMINERISSGEGIVAGIDDVFPRVLQRRSK